MPPYKKCCECPCVGENCLQGYAAGCNHPCCYCEDIQGKTTCDDDYCSTLFACHVNQMSGSDCSSLTFDVTITYPGKPPSRTVSMCGGEFELPDAGKCVQVTNEGFGVPPGLGDATVTTTCASKVCEECTEPFWANCDRVGGISELSSGRVFPARDWETETTDLWPPVGGQKVLTASYVGGCMWRGVGYLDTTGSRIYLHCDGGRYIDCGDPLVESTTACNCPPSACHDPDHELFEACENSNQCNEWPTEEMPLQPGVYRWVTNCYDNPQPYIWTLGCSYNADTGGYNCQNVGEDYVPGVPYVWRCDYVKHTVPIRWKATYTLWYDVGDPCEKGYDSWKQKIEFEPVPDYGQADPSIPSDHFGGWAPILQGSLLSTPEGKCYAGTCCEVDCEDEGVEDKDLLPFNQMHYSGYEVCSAECLNTTYECSTCFEEGPGDCEPCGYSDPLIKALGGNTIEGLTCPLPLVWPGCEGTTSDSTFVWQYWYNSTAPQAFVVDSGAGQLQPPCSVTCPTLDYLQTEWGWYAGNFEWVGFKVEIT